MMRLRQLRQRLTVSTGLSPVPIFTRQRRAYDQSRVLVLAFYAANAFLAISRWTDWQRFNAPAQWLPLWPLQWVSLVGLEAGIYIILALNTVGAVGGLGCPEKRWARIVACVGIFQYAALTNSFGRIGHDWHAWLWVSFFFIFLPDGHPRTGYDSRRLRQSFLNIIWTAQFAMLFFYSMAGALKLVPVPIQLAAGEVGPLEPTALARHIADDSLELNSHSLLGPWFIQHLWLSWPAFLGAIYLEFFSIFVAFRPALHRLWGMGLLAMHTMIGLAMDIWFLNSTLLLGLFLVNSPFAPRQTSPKITLASLPMLSWLVPFACSAKTRLTTVRHQVTLHDRTS